jgi:hypothetical protein
MFNAERYRRDAYFNAESDTPSTPVLPTMRQRLYFIVKFCIGCFSMLLLMVGLKICFSAFEYNSFGNKQNEYLLRKVSDFLSGTEETKPISLDIGTTNFTLPATYVISKNSHALPDYKRAAIELSWRTGKSIPPQHSLLNLLKWQEDIVWVQLHTLTDMTQLNTQNRLLIDDMQTKTGDPLKEGINVFASKSSNAFEYAVLYSQGTAPILFKCTKSISFIKVPTCTATMVYKDSILLTYTIAQSVIAETNTVTTTLKTFFAAHEDVEKPAKTVVTKN